MDTDFLQWLYQEAEEGRWDQKMVFKALTKEEVDGKVNITTRIKSEFELESAGPAGDYLGPVLGKFELVPGEEEEGCPVYQQAQSRKIPSKDIYLLYRSNDEWLV